jgi:GTP-binding nuclear protein Ran
MTHLQQVYTIALLGSAGVGKTAILNRYQNGDFIKKYTSTVGKDIKTLMFKTSVGPVVVRFLDIAGQEMYEHKQKEYLKNVDAVMLVFDIDSKVSYRRLSMWYKKCPDVPVVVIGNKFDLQNHQVKLLEQDIVFNVSAKLNHNLEKPLLYLLKKLISDNVENVELVKS